MRAVSLIEPLEDRIAPATVLTIAPNGKSASFTDSAGDTIEVTTTKGTFTTAQFTFDSSSTGQLTELALTGHKDFTGANIVFTITPVAAAGSTATVNVGYIDAIGLNLGSVTLPGDLGRIDVGGGATARALGSLTVKTLGVEGSTTQGGLSSPSTTSNITGTVGAINVAGDVDGSIFVQDFNSKPGTGNIGLLNIGGSLDGNTSTGAGEIVFSGRLSTAVIGGGIEGGSSDFSGSIAGLYGEGSSIGSITVKGSVPDDPNPSPIPSIPGTSILGGAGRLSGSISAVTVGTVVVAGDVYGGTGTASGGIQAGSHLGSVTIDGSLIGGNFVSGSPSEATSSGVIFGGSVGTVTIEGNIYGGSGLSSGEVYSTGLIQTVTVMGNVAGGSAGQASTNGLSGIIHGQSLGNVTIKGSLIGGNLVSGDANQLGTDDGAVLSDTTIGSVTIGKDVVGGSGSYSNTMGMIATEAGAVGTVTIAGSIQGGSGASSGDIAIDGALGKLSLGGNLTGGSGSGSGLIEINGAAASLLIGGSVIGGTADNTGTISTFGLLGSATIKGGITGSNSGSVMLTNTGYIQADGIGTLTLDGALTAGTAGSGGLDTSGAIRSQASIGSITLGSIVGNATNAAVISAMGRASLTGTGTSDVAIGAIKVIGNTSYGDILAGYSTDTDNGAQPLGLGVNADAQIGTVTIGGNLTATNIIAGAGPGTGGFGTASSTALTGAGVSDLPTIISSISKVVIGGTVTPTSSTTDSYGIAAQSIGSATVNGAKLTLVAGPDNDTFAAGKEQKLGGTGADVVLYEV